MPVTATAYKDKFTALDIESDGFNTVDLNDGRIMWMLNDNISPAQTSIPPATMKPNAWVIQSGETFTMQRIPVPFTSASLTRQHWPLFGWAYENVLHVLCDSVYPSSLTDPGPLGFYPTIDNTSLHSYYLPSLTKIEDREHIPLPSMPGDQTSIWTSWAQGLWNDGTDVWIYGSTQENLGGGLTKQIHVARCPLYCLADTFKWEYEGPVPPRTNSAQLSCYDDGKAVTKGVLDSTAMRWSASDPTFSDVQIEAIPDVKPYLPAGMQAYGAHAHPWLPPLTSGKMLMTVNINAWPTRYFPAWFEIDR